jgi:hypothetical protein
MSLIESIAALVLEAIVMTGLVATLSTATTFADRIRTQRDAVVDSRRVEQLLDHVFLQADIGPLVPSAIALAEPTRIVVHADLDGDRLIDPHSSERTEFALQRDGASQRLVHRIGRQSVTVVRDLPGDARFDYRDAEGNFTGDRLAIRLVRISIGSTDYSVALRPPLS